MTELGDGLLTDITELLAEIGVTYTFTVVTRTSNTDAGTVSEGTVDTPWLGSPLAPISRGIRERVTVREATAVLWIAAENLMFAIELGMRVTAQTGEVYFVEAILDEKGDTRSVAYGLTLRR